MDYSIENTQDLMNVKDYVVTPPNPATIERQPIPTVTTYSSK
jgi:hypothetical protein